jgi:hypothetical protein
LSKKNIQAWVVAVAAILFLLPLIFYAYKFGFGLWGSHGQWAEMGSFFSGIYSPIIALIALLILVGQSLAQAALNKHQYDQTYIQENRKDLDFYIEKLERFLTTKLQSGESVGELMNRNITHLTKEQLRGTEAKAVTAAFYLEYRLAFDIWVSIYPILIGLASQKEYPYEHNFQSSKLKIITILSWECCVALDKLYFSRAEKVNVEDMFFWKNKTKEI